MGKPYFNDAIIGNSKMLGCLTKEGELIRLFWPNIDFSQQIEAFHMGIYVPSTNQSTFWLHENFSWEHKQSYIEDTNILETICSNDNIGLNIKQTDFLVTGEDVVVRHISIRNITEETKQIKFVLLSSMISTENDLRSTMFKRENNSLIHYSHDKCFTISASVEAESFQIGNVYDNARKGQLYETDEVGMSGSGAIIWDLGEIYGRETKEITIYLYAAKCYKDAIMGMKAIKEITINGLIESVADYWKEFIKNAKQINVLNKEIYYIYKRTLLTFALMNDQEYGGILAAPEVDEGFTKCGRYGYCYGRDATFIAEALDKCGLTKIAEEFYHWCFSTQLEDGSWHQRYYMNGDFAPSWGIQIDEIGAILWGIWRHFETVKNTEFLQTSWEYVRRAAEFLIAFMDTKTGLPKPTFDLWEMRVGEHAFSAAAVYAGLNAAAQIAENVGGKDQHVNQWQKEAEKLKKSIKLCFYDEKLGRLIRSVKVTRNEWESVGRNEEQPLGYIDTIIDVSLIGTSIPFDVFPVTDTFIIKTANAIEEALSIHLVGGIKRFENDEYIGGNPWIIATLWMAQYHIKAGNYAKAKEYFDWVVKYKALHGFLPEQIDKNSGQPAWIIQLTWSHAMFVIVLFELLEHGVEI